MEAVQFIAALTSMIKAVGELFNIQPMHHNDTRGELEAYATRAMNHISTLQQCISTPRVESPDIHFLHWLRLVTEKMQSQLRKIVARAPDNSSWNVKDDLKYNRDTSPLNDAAEDSQGLWTSQGQGDTLEDIDMGGSLFPFLSFGWT